MKITDTKTWGQTKKVLYRFIEDACNSYVLQGNNQQWEVIEPKLDFLLASQLEEVAEGVKKMKYSAECARHGKNFVVSVCKACMMAFNHNLTLKNFKNDVLSYLKGEMK